MEFPESITSLFAFMLLQEKAGNIPPNQQAYQRFPDSRQRCIVTNRSGHRSKPQNQSLASKYTLLEVSQVFIHIPTAHISLDGLFGFSKYGKEKKSEAGNLFSQYLPLWGGIFPRYLPLYGSRPTSSNTSYL